MQTLTAAYQGSVSDLILLAINFNDLADNMTIDHLLYADDVELIATRKKTVALQNSLASSAKFSNERN